MTTTDTRSAASPPVDQPAGGTTPGAGPDAPAPDRRRWAAFVIMTVATFMDMLDGTIVNVAVPTIQRDLGATFSAVQWITAGYVLAFALLLITGGRLGDIYGRRQVFQFGVAGFTIASLLCGIATDPGMLVAARLLQGAMAGLMVPQVLSIIHVTFPNEEKGKVFALHGMVGGIAATVAPLVGGVIVAANIFGWDWRPIFLVNVPIGVAGFILGWKYIPDSKAPNALRLDLIGVVIGTVGLLLLLFPLTFGRELGWPAWAYASIVLAIGTLAAFVYYERYKDRKDGSPLVVLGLFKARSFSSALALTLSCFAFTGMFMLALYLFVQLGLGWTPLRAGLTLLAFAVGAFLTATAAVIGLVPKFGRTVLQVGAVVMALGVGVFLWTNSALGWELTSWSMVPALFIIGLGFGATATPISLFGLSEVPFEDAGSASGLINTMLQLGFTVGIAIVSLAFFAPLGPSAGRAVDTFAPQLRPELVAVGVPADRADAVIAGLRACTVDRLGGASPDETPASCALDPVVQQNARAAALVAEYEKRATAQSFSGAFQIALYTGLGMLVLVFLVVAGLPRRVAGPGQHA